MASSPSLFGQGATLCAALGAVPPSGGSPAAGTSTSAGAGASSGTAGNQNPPAPPPTATGLASQTGSAPLHEPVESYPPWVRLTVFVGAEILLYFLLASLLYYILSRVGLERYVWSLAGIAWVVLSALVFSLFFRTVGVYQLAHTQDLLTGALRRYGSGTKLLLPTEVLTPERIVDTEAVVVKIPETKVTTADGSPMLASGLIRFRVIPKLSHRFIGMRKDAVEESLLAAVLQIIREEVGRCEEPETAIRRFMDTKDAHGQTVPGIRSIVEDVCMNGAGASRFENDHGVQVEGVPFSLVMAPETEKRLLSRLEDRRLAESAEAILGVSKGGGTKEERMKATELALLNDPNSKLVHTVAEKIESGDRSYRLTVDGPAGETLKDFAALGTIIGHAISEAFQKKETEKESGGGSK